MFASGECYITLKRRRMLVTDIYANKQLVSQYYDMHDSSFNVEMGPYEEIVVNLQDVKSIVATIKFGISKAKQVEITFDIVKGKLKLVSESGFPKLSYT